MRLGDFASAEATTGFALWIPTTFEKVDETFIWVRCYFCLAHRTSCKAATAAEHHFTACSKPQTAAPQKNKKIQKPQELTLLRLLSWDI